MLWEQTVLGAPPGVALHLGAPMRSTYFQEPFFLIAFTPPTRALTWSWRTPSSLLCDIGFTIKPELKRKCVNLDYDIRSIFICQNMTNGCFLYTLKILKPANMLCSCSSPCPVNISSLHSQMMSRFIACKLNKAWNFYHLICLQNVMLCCSTLRPLYNIW